MGVWSVMKTWFILHLILCLVFIISGCIVSFLMLITYITVWPFNRTLYRKIVVNLAYTIWCQFTFLGQWWSGSDCHVYLEKEEDLKYIGKEHTIVIMNHKYDIDWLMAWILAERFGMLGGTKIYGKSSLRFLPIIGWLWTFTESIFLKRQWDKDRNIIARDLRGVCSYPDDYWVTLLLFPEGTRFTATKHKESMVVAQAKNMPELKHHLLPRTKGFVHSMHGVRGRFHSITDLTIGIHDEGFEPSLLNLIFGHSCHADIVVRRIPIDNVPEEEEACAAWLHQLFREKDQIYDDFAQHGRFTHGDKYVIPWRWWDMIVELFWIMLIGLPGIYYIAQVFLTGSLYAQLIFVGLLVIGSWGVRAMIAVSETNKGSKYGKKVE